jgi:spermidine/putrescine transport system permease protein
MITQRYKYRYNFGSLFVTLAAVAALLFLYIPLFIIVLYSFNDASVSAFPIENFSLKWYYVMWENESLFTAVRNSLVVAGISTTLAVLIGVPAAYALHKHNYFFKETLERIILMPITLPGIVTGVAMLSFFPIIGFNISLTAVIIGHATFLLAIVVTQMLTRFKQLDPFLEQAASDLGATPTRAFFAVVLPNIRTALIGAILLCLVLSMDEIPVTYFLTARDNTLPMEIYGMMRTGITPEVNAISTLVFVFSSAAILLSLWLSDRGHKS